jgi:hypothetical protein
METKKCTKCGEIKPLEQFSKSVKTKDGKQHKCKQCHSQYSKQHRILNGDKLRASSLKYYHNNRDKQIIKGKEYRKNNKDKTQKYKKEYTKKNRGIILDKQSVYRKKPATKQQILKNHLKTNYNLTLEQYDKMVLDQNGVCAICGKPETRLSNNGVVTRLCVDHNHKTGKVRKLLCHRCNSSIGQFEDDVGLLNKAIQYLLENQ